MKKTIIKFSQRTIILIIGLVFCFFFIYSKLHVDEMKELEFTINDSQSSFIPLDSFSSGAVNTKESFIERARASSKSHIATASDDELDEIFNSIQSDHQIHFSFRIWKEKNTTPIRKLLNKAPHIKYAFMASFAPTLRFSYSNCFIKPTSENYNGLVNFLSNKKKETFSGTKPNLDYYTWKVCPSVKVNIFLIDNDGNIIREKIDDKDLFLIEDSENGYWSGQLFFDKIVEMWYSNNNGYGGTRSVSQNTLDNFGGIYSEISFYNIQTGKYTVVDKRKVFFKP
tara:strand:- start:41 stop:889 length:849 start_codon:yes stop_codon:yes gene_type:complete